MPELLSPWSWGVSPAFVDLFTHLETFQPPDYWDFMEASSCRQDQFPAPLLSLEKGKFSKLLIILGPPGDQHPHSRLPKPTEWPHLKQNMLPVLLGNYKDLRSSVPGSGTKTHKYIFHCLTGVGKVVPFDTCMGYAVNFGKFYCRSFDKRPSN